MILRFKVGTHPAWTYYVCRRRVKPKIGEKFFIVDKSVHGSKPFKVRLDEVKMHTGAGEIYFVEMM